MTVVARYTATAPCPVCSGYPGLEQGKSIRCAGFLSEDGRYARCTREEYAGGLELDDTTPATFVHLLTGDCRCGTSHGQPVAANGYRRDGTIAARLPEIEATYDYHDAAGSLAFQVVRFAGKDFRQRQPAGNGRWRWGIDGVKRVLYRRPELLAADPAALVYICEGEKDVDRLWGLGFVATTNPMGAGKWRPEYTNDLRGRHVIILPDNDQAGADHGAAVERALQGVAASVRIVPLPGLPARGDITDWLGAGHTVEELLALVEGAPGAEVPPSAHEPAAACSLAEVEQVFSRWLAGKDPVPLRAVLGAYAANMLDGDPVWLMLVGGSGRGKTEMADSLRGRPDTRSVSSISHESALLSGTPRKDAAKDASGGLLRQIGASGMLIIKDFTTILSMHRDARAGVLAALREVYDGHWSRNVGAEGGRTLTWEGRLGLIAGCTSAIDRAHAVTAVMGERFLIVRVPDGDANALARKSLDQVGREATMRAELAGAVGALFDHGLPAPAHRVDSQVIDKLVALVTLVTKARSPVERDYQGEIDLVLDSEGPTRITKQLARLYAALGAVGLEPAASWDVVLRAGLDSIPKLRGAVLKHLLRVTGTTPTTTEVAEAVSHPTQTTRRALQDLEAHGVVSRVTGSKGVADRWRVAEWAATSHGQAQGVPEMSDVRTNSTPPSSLNYPLHVDDDISGKVPDASETASGSYSKATADEVSPERDSAVAEADIEAARKAASDADAAARLRRTREVNGPVLGGR